MYQSAFSISQLVVKGVSWTPSEKLKQMLYIRKVRFFSDLTGAHRKSSYTLFPCNCLMKTAFENIKPIKAFIFKISD